MSRFYTIKAAATDLTAANGNYDWLEIAPNDDKPVRLWGWILSQKDQLGDAEELNVLFRLLRLTSLTTGSSGITPSVSSMVETEQAISAGFTAEAFNATVATTGGSTRELMEFYWNLRGSPYEFWFPSREWCPIVRQGEGLILRQDDTLPNTIKCAATYFVEEDG